MHYPKKNDLGVRNVNVYEIGGIAILAIVVYFGVRLFPEIRRYVKISRM